VRFERPPVELMPSMKTGSGNSAALGAILFGPPVNLHCYVGGSILA
jgi:hypothetical protein